MFISCNTRENKSKENSTKESVVSTIELGNLITIVKQNNEFKLSCAKKINKVNISDKQLFLEIVEPTNYQIEKIEKSDLGFKVYLKDEEFFYDVSLIDKEKGIFYWKNLSKNNNEIDEDFSFYTVEESKLSTLNLKVEDCGNDKVLEDKSTWEIKCTDSNESYYFKYSLENNEGSLSGMLKKDFAFSITGNVERRENTYEFTYSQNYSSLSESESEQFWNDFSVKEKIADIKILNNHQIEFKWYGFYNDKTKKREYTKNPFTLDVEHNTIILEKCE